MKRYRIICLFLPFLFSYCGSKKQSTTSENDIDAARNFIRAALDGKFDEARNFMLSDSVNANYMDVAERSFRNTDAETKNGYRVASINMHQVAPINDSTTIVIYSNSFKNDHDTLKVVKENGQWLVDLKYLYQHDMDTMQLNKPTTDSTDD
jgi:hypothetical protein